MAMTARAFDDDFFRRRRRAPRTGAGGACDREHVPDWKACGHIAVRADGGGIRGIDNCSPGYGRDRGCSGIIGPIPARAWPQSDMMSMRRSCELFFEELLIILQYDYAMRFWRRRHEGFYRAAGGDARLSRSVDLHWPAAFEFRVVGFIHRLAESSTFIERRFAATEALYFFRAQSGTITTLSWGRALGVSRWR